MAITRQPDGSLERVESWENANNRAQIAAAAMLNLPLPEKTPGWFWTDQFNDNLQFVGDMQGQTWFCRGNPDDGKAIWFHLRDGKLIGAVALNNGREVRALRKLIHSGRAVSEEELCDEGVALKSLDSSLISAALSGIKRPRQRPFVLR